MAKQKKPVHRVEMTEGKRNIIWKTIYQAADEKKALVALDRVTEKWSPQISEFHETLKDN